MAGNVTGLTSINPYISTSNHKQSYQLKIHKLNIK